MPGGQHRRSLYLERYSLGVVVTRWGRRALLTSGIVSLAGCAVTDPLIRPGGSFPEPPTTEFDPVQSTALEAETRLADLWRAITATAPSWPEAKSVIPIASRRMGVHDEHIARLRAVDPLLPGDDPFHPAASSGSVVVASWADALTQVKTLQEKALTSHRLAITTTVQSSQPLALLYASLAASATGSPELIPAQFPGVGPRPFAAATITAVYPVVLSRVWALSYALETGLGRFGPESEIRTGALSRLEEVKQLRDDLLARPELATPPRQQADYDLGGPIGTPEEVLLAWTRAELALLSAWGRLTVASQAEPSVIAAMISQVRHAERWRHGLPTWPGWV